MNELNELEHFCEERGFLFHAHGSGKWGSERYWTYYKVENNADTRFSIEYFPVQYRVKIRIGANRYEGLVESLTHLKELLEVMRIHVNEIIN